MLRSSQRETADVLSNTEILNTTLASAHFILLENIYKLYYIVHRACTKPELKIAQPCVCYKKDILHHYLDNEECIYRSTNTKSIGQALILSIIRVPANGSTLGSGR